MGVLEMKNFKEQVKEELKLLSGGMIAFEFIFQYQKKRFTQDAWSIYLDFARQELMDLIERVK